jgi:uncharacterized protein YjiS (DUF1127 family)
MNACIDHSEFKNRINESSLRATRISSVFCAVSRLFQKLAQLHTRRTLTRQTKQELHALSDASLKDIGLRRGDIGNLADELASRARHCR